MYAMDFVVSIDLKIEKHKIYEKKKRFVSSEREMMKKYAFWSENN